MNSDIVVCLAEKVDGSKCRQTKDLNANGYCKYHQDSKFRVPFKDRVYCKAITNSNKPCHQVKLSEDGYCEYHNKAKFKLPRAIPATVSELPVLSSVPAVQVASISQLTVPEVPTVPLVIPTLQLPSTTLSESDLSVKVTKPMISTRYIFQMRRSPVQTSIEA